MPIGVSVIIPCYNRAAMLPRAIDSVLGQTLPPREVIVVDDGSADDSRAVAESYGEPVRVFSQQNRGPSAARNRGVREARAPYVAFLDTDDLWLPDKLARQCEVLQEHREIDFVHAQQWTVDEATGGRTMGPLWRRKFQGHCFEQLFWGSNIGTSTVLVRRDCFDRVGGFDEAMRYSEDYDLWIRLARICKFAYLEAPLVERRIHAGNTIRDEQRMNLGELCVIQKIMRETNSIFDTIPRKSALNRLANVHVAVGYGYLEQSELAQARSHFWAAWRHCSAPARCSLLWLATSLPGPIFSMVRHAKQRLGRRLASSENGKRESCESGEPGIVPANSPANDTKRDARDLASSGTVQGR